MSKVLKESILKKIFKLNVSKSTITGFTKEIDKIISSKYQMMDKLKLLRNSINSENNSLSKVKKVIAQHTKEIKATIREVKQTKSDKIKQHLLNVPTGFVNGQNALSKAIGLIKGEITVKQLKVHYKKKGIVAIRVKKRMTRMEIKDLTTKISKTMKDHNINGEIGCAMLYPNMWSPALFTSYGASTRLWSNDDSEAYDEVPHYEQIEIYLSETPRASGGESKINDCLYKALWYYLHDKMPWKCDYAMKKALGIEPYCKIDIKHMNKLEKSLQNISINVTGDYTYTSTLNKNLIIDLKLINEHYTVDYEKIDEKIKRVSNNELKPILYNEDTNLGYDGNKIRKITKQEKSDMYLLKSDYILVKADTDKCLIEQYNEFITNADLLKKESKIINLYKTGSNSNTALYLFDRFTHHIKNPPPIRQAEAEFIIKSKQGALIFAEPYQGSGYKLDIVSSYPSIMNSGSTFPIKEGEFKNLTKDEFDNIVHFQYGIYRCTIIGYNKQFRKNVQHDYYTHIDLTEARRLKLKINIIVDNQPNFLHYSRDKLLTGKELFGQYINELFELKNKGIKISKKIINILWGKLGQSKIIKYNISNDQEMIYIDDNIKHIRPSEKGHIISTTKSNHEFKYTWARMTPFLLSKGREKIAKIIDSIGNENVYRCHTDGIISKILPTNTGNNLGDLKFELYSDNIQIINCNKVTF